ncbi:zinc finger domain-containing protein [Streptomyces anandii]
MEYFTLVAKPTGHDPATIEAALRRAWNACAGVACPKCGVPPWQYCRNWTSGGPWYVTRFHRPRQDAAGAPEILAPVGIYGLSWAKGTGRFTWEGRRVPSG